jgi:hypothetical protein
MTTDSRGAGVSTTSGIGVDAWVKIDGDCDITWDVEGEEAEFRFGGRSYGLDMIVTEEGLENLVRKGTEALHRMRAGVGDCGG